MGSVSVLAFHCLRLFLNFFWDSGSWLEYLLTGQTALCRRKADWYLRERQPPPSISSGCCLAISGYSASTGQWSIGE